MKTTRACAVLAVSVGSMLVLCWLLAGAQPPTVHAAGSVIYVDGDAAGGGDGQSWATAFRTVEEALSGAGAGDEIWVAEGVYTPTNVAGRAATFRLKDGVGLYGGFAGTETARGERDWEAHVTVLSGDLDGDDVTDADGVVTATIHIVGENACHVVTGSGVTETARLDGFTLTSGKANGGSPHYGGGGMVNDGGNPTVVNVTFSGNTAGSYGGGMCNTDGSPTLVNVTFSGNTAKYGGGMKSSGGSPALENVTFIGNTAKDGGGMTSSGGSPALVNVTFIGNAASDDCGGMLNAGSSPTLVNVTFSGNTAADWGGAMRSAGGSPKLTNVTFSGNTAKYAGGMLNWDSSPMLANCILWGNSAGSGAQIYNDDSSTPVISYTLLQGSGGSGAGWMSGLGSDGGGNLDAAPQFVRVPSDGGDGWGVGDNDDYGDLRLRVTSPAIDAGDNAAVPAGVTTDLDGHLRFFDVPFVADMGSGTPPIVDMGAYEAHWLHRCFLPLVLK